MTDTDNRQAEQAAGAADLDTGREADASLAALYGPVIVNKARAQVSEKTAQAVAVTSKTVEQIRTTADAIEAGTATKEDIAAMGQATKETTEIIERTASEIAEITRAANTAIKVMGRALNNTTRLLKRMAAEWAASIEAFLVSPEWDELRAMFPDITEDDGGILLMTGLVKPIIENADALQERIESYEDDIGHPLTFDDLINADDDHITSGLTLLEQFLLDLGAFTDIEQPAGRSISNNQLSEIHYPVDKVNGGVWGLSEKEYRERLLYRMESVKRADGGELKRKPKELTLVCFLNFDALEANGITVKRKLTYFDKRVYIALASLYLAGNDEVTLSEVWRAMGNRDTTPAPNQLKNIRESITKMIFTYLKVDDREEHESYNYDINDPEAGWNDGLYDGPLLHAAFVGERTRVRGQTTHKTLQLYNVPALVSFAKMRKQFTTIDPKLLQAPQNKTEGNLAIEDYLLIRISRAKKNSNKRREKILLETLYDRAGITTKKQKQRAPEKIRKYLDYYKEQGSIRRYDLQADSVTIYF